MLVCGGLVERISYTGFSAAPPDEAIGSVEMTFFGYMQSIMLLQENAMMVGERNDAG